jgi:polysaccharide biosynthesis transport protein
MEIVPLPSDGNQQTELKPALNGQPGQSALNQTGFIVPPVYGEIGNGTGSYYPSYDKPEKEESFDLREFGRKVLRRKWLILAIVAIATTLTALKISQARNIYQSTATIEVGRRVPKLGKDSSMNLFYDFDNSEIKTAMFLLKSTPLLEDVVVNYKLDQNEQFLGGEEPRVLSNIFKRKEPATEPKKADIPNESLSELEYAKLNLNLNLRSREEREALEPYVNMLMGGLTVTELRGTRLVQIAFSHTDPHLAAVVTNGVAQTFIERVYRKQNEKIEQTSTWLDKSTRDLQAQQQKAEQALADYTRNNNIFATEGKDDLTTTKLAELHGQAMKAETERSLKQSLFEEVKRGNVSKLPEAFSDQTINELQKKVGELTVTSAQLNVKYGSRNPKVIEVQEQMDALRKEINEKVVRLEERLKAEYERAVRDENSLKAALTRAKGEAVQQNQTAIQYNILKQNVETAKALYTDFLQKTKQAEIEKAEQTHHVSVAQPATRGLFVGPKRLRTIFIAFLLSLAAGIGLAFLLDHLDNRIKTVDDVNRYVRLPALGVIPEINSSAPRKLLGSRHGSGSSEQSGFAIAGGASNVTSLADRRAAHSVAEAYRSLRTSVLLAAAGRPPKTILVTSSQPGEGKTTTIVNTAICLSQLGAKVLLVDADMRRPRVHKAFGIKNRRGLSTYLSSEARLRDLIQTTSIPNLSVLPSGLVPPNSADLVSSEKMRYMLHKLSAHYDHILIDTPPVHSVTDPIILSRQVDGVILVVHGGKSTREMVRHARQELINVGAKIFGVVLNNVNVQQDGYEYYYHRYYYGQQEEKTQVKGA